MSQKYADIIIGISHEAIDRTFQYIIPEDMVDVIQVGMQVEVLFGNAKKPRKGFVVSITDTPCFDVARMKSIVSIPAKSLQMKNKLIQLAEWMHRTYGSTMINCLNTVMPVKEKVREAMAKVTVPEFELTKPPVQNLNIEQQKLLEEFIEDCNREYGEEEVRKPYLLQGITGSGKTEVYIACIKEIVKQGGQAIVLIPEIGLTYQNVARFKQHFGDRVALINSKQSKGEKYREFMRAEKGEVDVIIGPRSALFSPCKNLKLIIMDEEHDNAYKSDQSPKYHTKDVAIERARLEEAFVILGTATPSLESYAEAKLSNYKLWKLSERPDGMVLPTVSIVDLREEFHMGNRSIISKELHDKIEDRLARKEQIMLFINRRGYNSFVSCRDCGDVIKCPKCDVSLSLHDNGFLKCHYCGHIERMVKSCPSCKSKMIGGFGTGTEKIEEAIKKEFPVAKVLRMDKDTTMAKGAHGDIINRFIKQEADILIGTQMIVKGHDFSNVTLVGVILADMSLFANDYRAGERTFDLLVQAAGRAGRGEKKGSVVIQTYQPEHYAIVAAANQDYEGFFDTEMSYRRLMKYPPVYNMLVVLITSDNYEKTCDYSEKLRKLIDDMISEDEKRILRVIGPSDATIGKINNIFRRVIYIKSTDLEKIGEIRRVVENEEEEGILVYTDMNPIMTY